MAIAPALQLVIFDCDGVLVDSEHLAVEVEVGILGDLGWDLAPEEIVDRFLGLSDADYQSQIEDHLGRLLPPGWLADMTPRYREAFDRELAPVKGVEEAIEALEAAGLSTCVASSGDHEKIRHNLDLTGLYERFAGRIYSATEVELGKPAPDLFLRAASQMGVPAKRCAVVEDSPAGLAGAL
ncbi:MAG: HAD family hydrolase, partial [Acidimicrobiales bacterium]